MLILCFSSSGSLSRWAFHSDSHTTGVKDDLEEAGRVHTHDNLSPSITCLCLPYSFSNTWPPPPSFLIICPRAPTGTGCSGWWWKALVMDLFCSKAKLNWCDSPRPGFYIVSLWEWMHFKWVNFITDPLCVCVCVRASVCMSFSARCASAN